MPICIAERFQRRNSISNFQLRRSMDHGNQDLKEKKLLVSIFEVFTLSVLSSIVNLACSGLEFERIARMTPSLSIGRNSRSIRIVRDPSLIDFCTPSEFAHTFFQFSSPNRKLRILHRECRHPSLILYKESDLERIRRRVGKKFRSSKGYYFQRRATFLYHEILEAPIESWRDETKLRTML